MRQWDRRDFLPLLGDYGNQAVNKIIGSKVDSLNPPPTSPLAHDFTEQKDQGHVDKNAQKMDTYAYEFR